MVALCIESSPILISISCSTQLSQVFFGNVLLGGQSQGITVLFGKALGEVERLWGGGTDRVLESKRLLVGK